MAAVLGSPAAAHPHVFLDTILVLTFDPEQRLSSIRVAWLYDDFFSMSLFADMGLDNDLDGKLTDAEIAKLQGFNLNWPKDFSGVICMSRLTASVSRCPARMTAGCGSRTGGFCRF